MAINFLKLTLRHDQKMSLAAFEPAGPVARMTVISTRTEQTRHVYVDSDLVPALSQHHWYLTRRQDNKHTSIETHVYKDGNRITSRTLATVIMANGAIDDLGRDTTQRQTSYPVWRDGDHNNYTRENLEMVNFATFHQRRACSKLGRGVSRLSKPKSYRASLYFAGKRFRRNFETLDEARYAVRLMYGHVGRHCDPADLISDTEVAAMDGAMKAAIEATVNEHLGLE
jgi:hypothetical protein